MTDPNNNNSDIEINRGRLGSITVYDVTEDELEILENGSPNSIYLNFAIGLTSIGVSFFITIFATEIKNIKTYVVFWVIAVITTLAGVVLFVVWRRSNKGMKNVIKRIRDRFKPSKSKEILDVDPQSNSASEGSKS